MIELFLQSASDYSDIGAGAVAGGGLAAMIAGLGFAMILI